MFFVSSILISKDAMWTITKFFEGYFFFGRSYPWIVSIVVALVIALLVTHAVLATRKFPISYHQFKAFRSHMRMKGRWCVLPRDAEIFGVPWLVLRGQQHMGVLSGGAVLELDRGVARRIGPDILAEPPDFDAMVRNLRAIEQSREVGDALLDQRLIGGIGNVWKVESLWAERVSPWLPLADVSDDALGGVLLAAHRLMRNRLDGVRVRAQVYRKKERPCPRCGTPIRSWPQGDQARMAYWCPQCQRGEGPRMK